MNKRQIKLSCYLEQLNIEVVKVEMILNQLNRLKNNQEIANYIIERDLLKTKSIRIITCFFVYYSKKNV